MKRTYGSKSIMITAFIAVVVVALAYFIIRQRYVWMAFGLLVIIDLIRTFSSRYQLAVIEKDTITFKSPFPFSKTIVIPTKEIDNIAIVGANFYSYLIIVSAGTKQQRVRMSMHISEFRNVVNDLSAIGFHIETKGLASGSPVK